jgi:hypothetical protein
VAGIIAALNNQYGVLGTASGAEIYSVKVLNSSGSGNYSNVILGIDWAIENDMDIISISFGGANYSYGLHEAVKKAAENNITVIAAAGNYGKGADTMVYPAKYPEVISVGAVDRNNFRAYFSSTGPELDIMAPGWEILSTVEDAGYGVMSGTSMAAPHVSGAAAVLMGAGIGDSEDIISLIKDNAIPLGDANNYGAGLLDLDRALGLDNSAFPDFEDPDDALQPEISENTEAESFFDIKDFDRDILDSGNELQSLIQLAEGLGEIDLAKEIAEEYYFLYELNSDFHKLPEDLEQNTSKVNRIQAQREDDYYTSRREDFLLLKEKYEAAVSNYAAIVENLILSIDDPEYWEFMEYEEKSGGDVSEEAYGHTGNSHG